MRKMAVIGALIALGSGAARAQESRGSIGGRVVDSGDAVIPRAKVVIGNVDTGIDTVLTTNDQGAYVAPLLIPGKYRVTAQHEGFKRFSRSGITLGVNDNLQIDITLQLGDVSQTVEIVAEAPLLEVADGSLGVTLSSKELGELPIAHGNPYALIGLAPGTTFEGDQKLNRPYEPTHIVDYSMSGAVSGTTDITLDGISNTSKGSNGRVAAGFVPPPDAVGEVRVQTSSFDARTGQTSGGLINISLKSGTNKLKGSAAYTKMRPEWFANDFFANRSGIPRGNFNYDRWSAQLDGPIVLPKIYNGHNKTFFMWAHEGLLDRRPRGGSTNLTVPTADMRKGDFSELLNIGPNYQIYSPFTRRRMAGSTTRYEQDPFPGNIVPASLQNPVALKALEYFALPLTAGTTVDHRNNYPQPNRIESTDYFSHIWRIDHNFSPRDRMFLRLNMYNRDSLSTDYFETRATGLREDFFSRDGAIDYVHAFSPTTLLNVRYGYTRFYRERTPIRGRNFDLTSLGFPKALNDAISADTREFPVFDIAGYFATINTGEARYMDTHSIVASVSRLRGNHSLDVGVEARAYRQNRYNGNSTRSGRYGFDTSWTKGPFDNSNGAPSSSGQSFAAFLLGLPRSGSTNSYISRGSDMAEQSTVWAGYFSDNWRVHRRLTLTLGVRYELEGPLTERFNRSVRDFAFGAPQGFESQAQAAYAAAWQANPTPELPPELFRVRGGLLFAGVGDQPRELWTRDKNNFAPRIGVAYALSRKLVFRGGYGIYFSGLGLRRTDVLQSGYAQNTLFVPTRDSGLSFYSTLSNPFPDGILEPTGSSLGILTDAGTSVEFFTPKPVASYNQRWQGSLQRQLGRSGVIEVAYVGNRSTKVEIDRDLNVANNNLLSRSPIYDRERVNYLTANIPNPFRGIPGIAGTIGTNSTISRENLLKPFPQFSAVTTTTYQGYAWYHALQTRVTRRFGAGLQMIGSYTWSKNMQATAYLNPGDEAPYESVAGSDRKHRFTLSTVYPLPIGRRGALLRSIPKPLNAVLGDWQVAVIYIYQSGSPLNWGDVIFFGNPDDINKGPKTVEQWFNINSGFTRNSATRPTSHYRTWPFRFSDVRGPAMNNVDLSINKRWKLRERGPEVQLRGESFNAFNRTQFSNPNVDQFSTSFGQITGTQNYARQIQVMLRVSF